MQGKSKNKTELTEICQGCGKPRRALRPGSLTSWMFKPETCLCPVLEAGEEEETVEVESRKDQRRQRAIKKAGTELNLGERFKILEKLGDGGMGTVYKVEDLSIKETLAVKVLNPVFARDFSKKRRFIREIKALERLDHPNIVTVYGYGEARNGLPFMVMEHISGVSLEDILRERKYLTEKDALPIFRAICEALDYSHAEGIVHRDLKPSNIMLIARDAGIEPDVKVVDFGISKLRQEGLNRTTNLTQTGEIFGSPYYMSPEQCHGEEIDKRSDVYSLGCLMYETLTGQPPFQGGNAVGVIMSHIKDKPRAFKRVNSKINVKPLVEAVVMQCLEKSSQKRFQSMNDLNSALKSAADAEKSIFLNSKGGMRNASFVPAIFALVVVLFFELAWAAGLQQMLPWQVIPRMLGLGKKFAIASQNNSIVQYVSEKATTREEALDEAIARRVALTGASITQLSMTGKHYVGINFGDVQFAHCAFDDSEFVGCDFTNATFKNCRFKGVFLADCAFHNARFDTCDFQFARLKRSPLREAKVFRCLFSGTINDETYTK